MSEATSRSSMNPGPPPEPLRADCLPTPLDRQSAVFDPHNARIKLFGETPEVMSNPKAKELIRTVFDDDDTYSKLTVYSPHGDPAEWIDLGFRVEARIGGFFGDGSDATLAARYSDAARSMSNTEREEREALRIALSKKPIDPPPIPETCTARKADSVDAERISMLLRSTFPNYPTNTAVEVIEDLISRRKSEYVLVEEHGRLVAMACAEIDHERRNAEISDCVTVKEHRGRGLMVAIINRLVERMDEGHDIVDCYCLARAGQIGMNAALARTGFAHDGRLVNNCRMPGGWETMNVWWRSAGRN